MVPGEAWCQEEEEEEEEEDAGPSFHSSQPPSLTVRCPTTGSGYTCLPVARLLYSLSETLQSSRLGT